ncbi:o-succinylbenzoate--CoA ligase [Staphylococcus massiliensis]|uniref:2-succinylbenzoate--CoA ligase n=1 Tax=Staphylococcus massiliensis S46 TaxID=1229783 RepID=K9ASK9_9STAP|nr:o-succinylbenzoate--CoA ligase [Staphylococcus massiliensis]EKU50304.1 O-succinylbenzoic acid-CoA ligase [Staphylococcus massiliensis S46]MCG3399670.1 o-succinylbenzoate--CoA ligase [Staphylococcus massiliensis]MCG3400775.1 o-succinylbenzoate--CoA ligase [Staphylococcus massiliensis]MCG3412061.1 o-succinylbenzoate--CoA ligase [Staphylococcus massiliensis]PNZ99053.1 o-succinylbenzoate--CoA ligase [Staphylococcus massiliensis CCUG 55927]
MEHWLKLQSEKNPHNTAIYHKDIQLTFKELYQKASQLAYVLKQLHTKRIGLHINNSVESVVLLHASILTGIEVALINNRLTEYEIINQMHSIDVTTIVTTNDFSIEEIDVIHYRTLIKKINEHTYISGFSEGDIASIMFTSGTTGPQKAVPQTFKNHKASAIGCKESLGFEQDSVWLAVLPIYHISGLSILLRSVLYGFAVQIEPKFDVHHILNEIKSKRITHISLVPQTLQWLMDAGLTEPYRLEKILLGGAKLSQHLVDKALAYHLPIYNSFGMTETCSQFLTASPALLKEDNETVGKPSENVEVKIYQPNEQGHGELLIKGDNVIDLYLYPNDYQAVSEDGYFHTGDIARISYDKAVYIYDRRKDLIISGGENIYPNELEHVLKLHADVDDAMCIGINDDTWGQVPMMYYISEKDLSEEALRSFLSHYLAKYKCPKQFKRVRQLPYTSTGKLIRKRLEDTIHED